jgi:hypothetical protein
MLVVSSRMKNFHRLLIFIIFLSSFTVSASFKCADRTYTLVLGPTTPGVPPKVTITPSLVHGGGTAVDTYQMKISYPHWEDATRTYSQYQQPGAFTGFVAIEGKGLQTIELLCTDTTERGVENNSYISISNKVTWESKVGDFKDSLKNGDLVEQHPSTGGRVLYKYNNGKLSKINLGANQNEFYNANLNIFIRAPSQVITPIATGAMITEMFGYSDPVESNSTESDSIENNSIVDRESVATRGNPKNKVSENVDATSKKKNIAVGLCSKKLKADIDAKYKVAFETLRLLHNKKKIKPKCGNI